MKRVTLSKIEAIELAASRKAGLQNTQTVFGIVCPQRGHIKSLEYVDGKWQETIKPVDIFIAEKLERVLVSNKRFIIVIGGRGSGKSVQIADMAIASVRDFGDKVYCLREFQNSLEDSVHSLITSEYDRLGISGFTTQNNIIYHESGGEFKFKGLARNPASIKSAAGFKRFIVEEAQTISEESLTALTPTARNKAKAGLPSQFAQEEKPEADELDLSGVQMIFVGNPGSAADPFSIRFINPFKDRLDRDGFYEDELHLVVVVNYEDNPWYSDSGLDGERIWCFENTSRAYYDHVWKGEYNDHVQDAIIQAEWFDACVDAHTKLGFKPQGGKIFSFDPADTGKDAKGYAVRHGSVILDAGEIDQPDINTSLDWAADRAIAGNVDLFNWDCDGMGVGLKREVDAWFSGKKIQVSQFRGSASPDRPDSIYEPVGTDSKPKNNRETFKNKRAQNYWLLRDRCYRTFRAVTLGEYIDPDHLISFSSGIKLLPKLRSELCRIPKKYNPSGYIQIMSKEEMRKLGIKSPNIADSVMMAMDAPETAVETFDNFEFKSLW